MQKLKEHQAHRRRHGGATGSSGCSPRDEKAIQEETTGTGWRQIHSRNKSVNGCGMKCTRAKLRETGLKKHFFAIIDILSTFGDTIQKLPQPNMHSQ